MFGFSMGVGKMAAGSEALYAPGTKRAVPAGGANGALDATIELLLLLLLGALLL